MFQPSSDHPEAEHFCMYYVIKVFWIQWKKSVTVPVYQEGGISDQ
jgi:hypothetical protein